MNTNISGSSVNLTGGNSFLSSDRQLEEDLKYGSFVAGMELNSDNERLRRKLWLDTFHARLTNVNITIRAIDISDANKLAKLAVDAYDVQFSTVK